VSVSSNSDKVSEDLSKVSESVKGNITKALETSAILVENEAKHLAPVDLGNLRNSIDHESDNESATIGTNVEYAPFQEFGTSKMKSQPFLTPAFESNRSRIVQILASGVKEGTS